MSNLTIRTGAVIGQWLKACGILSVLTRSRPQGAPAPTIRWSGQGTCAHIDAQFDVDAAFAGYEPAIILSPWTTTTKDADKVLDHIAGGHPRFGPVWRRAITIAADVREKAAVGGWDKTHLVRELRAEWPNEALAWLDTVVPLWTDPETGNPAIHFPVIGITGGNDGRWELSNNFLQCLGHVIEGIATPEDMRLRDERLAAALEITDTCQGVDGTTGPYSLDVEAEELFPVGFRNPWDMILLAEGILVYASHHTMLAAKHSVGTWHTWWPDVDIDGATAGQSRSNAVWTPTPSTPLTWATLEDVMRTPLPVTSPTTTSLQRAFHTHKLAPEIDSMTCWVFSQTRGRNHRAVPTLTMTLDHAGR